MKLILAASNAAIVGRLLCCAAAAAAEHEGDFYYYYYDHRTIAQYCHYCCVYNCNCQSRCCCPTIAAVVKRQTHRK